MGFGRRAGTCDHALSPDLGGLDAGSIVALLKERFPKPEPGEVMRDARFDPARVDRVLRAFSMLRHTKGSTVPVGGSMYGGRNRRAPVEPIWCSSMLTWGKKSW